MQILGRSLSNVHTHEGGQLDGFRGCANPDLRFAKFARNIL